jgi:hypothetical protein
MSSIVIKGNTSGQVEIAAPDVAGSTTLTLPTGTANLLTADGDGSQLTNLPQPAALSTASGSAPSYSARAWVNFQGTGTVAINASGNVSSITDRGVGYYQVNFTTNMPDVNYSPVVSVGGGSSSFPSEPHINESAYNARYAPVVSSFRYRIYVWNNGAAGLDMRDNTVAIFR